MKCILKNCRKCQSSVGWKIKYKLTGTGGQKLQRIEGEASNRKTWERVEGVYKNGEVGGEAVWDRPGLGVRLEGVFRRVHAHFAHGQGVVFWDDTEYR